MSDGKEHNFEYEVKNDFNVSIPSCAGKLRLVALDRGEELSLAEARSGLKSWSLYGELGRA